MDVITTLNLSEPSAIDTAAVQRLKRELGEKRCRSVVDEMIFEITDTMCRVERMVSARSYTGLADSLFKLQDLSAQMGLVCIVDVINDLVECLRLEDEIAIAAITARLVRLGEDGLFALIEFADRCIV